MIHVFAYESNQRQFCSFQRLVGTSQKTDSNEPRSSERQLQERWVELRILNFGICVNWAFGWNHSLKIMKTDWLYLEYKTWLICAQTPDCVRLRLGNWANSTIIIAQLGNKLSFSSKLMGFINGSVFSVALFLNLYSQYYLVISLLEIQNILSAHVLY